MSAQVRSTANTSNLPLSSFGTNWVKRSFFGARQKFIVDLDKEGVITVNNVSQTALQRLGSAIVELFSRGKTKDRFNDTKQLDKTYRVKDSTDEGLKRAREVISAAVSNGTFKTVDDLFTKKEISQIINDDLEHPLKQLSSATNAAAQSALPKPAVEGTPPKVEDAVSVVASTTLSPPIESQPPQPMPMPAPVPPETTKQPQSILKRQGQEPTGKPKQPKRVTFAEDVQFKEEIELKQKLKDANEIFGEGVKLVEDQIKLLGEMSANNTKDWLIAHLERLKEQVSKANSYEDVERAINEIKEANKELISGKRISAQTVEVKNLESLLKSRTPIQQVKANAYWGTEICSPELATDFLLQVKRELLNPLRYFVEKNIKFLESQLDSLSDDQRRVVKHCQTAMQQRLEGIKKLSQENDQRIKKEDSFSSSELMNIYNEISKTNEYIRTIVNEIRTTIPALRKMPEVPSTSSEVVTEQSPKSEKTKTNKEERSTKQPTSILKDQKTGQKVRQAKRVSFAEKEIVENQTVMESQKKSGRQNVPIDGDYLSLFQFEFEKIQSKKHFMPFLDIKIQRDAYHHALIKAVNEAKSDEKRSRFVEKMNQAVEVDKNLINFLAKLSPYQAKDMNEIVLQAFEDMQGLYEKSPEALIKRDGNGKPLQLDEREDWMELGQEIVEFSKKSDLSTNDKKACEEFVKAFEVAAVLYGIVIEAFDQKKEMFKELREDFIMEVGDPHLFFPVEIFDRAFPIASLSKKTSFGDFIEITNSDWYKNIEKMEKELIGILPQLEKAEKNWKRLNEHVDKTRMSSSETSPLSEKAKKILKSIEEALKDNDPREIISLNTLGDFSKIIGEVNEELNRIIANIGLENTDFNLEPWL